MILSVGHTNQSSFYVYRRQARGWNYDEPEVHQLDRDYFKEAKGFNPKSFNGFNHMVLVKVKFHHLNTRQYNEHTKGQAGFKDELWATSGTVIYVIDIVTFALRTTVETTASMHVEPDPARKVCRSGASKNDGCFSD